MTRLDDYLEPLHQGVWEVAVAKDSVTELLDDGWTKSALNLPTPGTIASYRKGQYHVHETAAEWRVHLDRYDPKSHPVLHLVDDAPLVFMISGTFLAVITDMKSALRGETSSRVRAQTAAWQVLVLAGFCMMLIGVLIGVDPLSSFEEIVIFAVRMSLLGLALVVIGRGLHFQPLRVVSGGRVLLGLCILIVGLISFSLELEWVASSFVLLLALWALASAIVSLKRTIHGRLAVPEGFYKRLGIGVTSLIFAHFILVAPDAVEELLVYVVSAIALLFGFSLVLEGLILRRRMEARM
ncbi:hypothetical protein FGU65_01835 [Methanoculleus sp. FWC-SCC1]|uniref:Uncharacterized protein n=1 Tax=Methanoculleus frigidifontis TaxID=2584085 RepID=A0ABT8M6U5_9EURY|nr:hypothetical protein [Methanoculleus sp. FWC-SCC1]MDN7023650.1 hypothetical protein [Methanoculleus sp. FWC-SCC1]